MDIYGVFHIHRTCKANGLGMLQICSYRGKEYPLYCLLGSVPTNIISASLYYLLSEEERIVHEW